MSKVTKDIWFKRKIYGWGWYPSTWQGWLITLLFILYLVFIALILPVKGKIIEYFSLLIIGIIILIYICYKKGEKPKWSWGKS